MTDLKKFKDNGVTFIDEKTTYIEDNVSIGRGTVVEPNVYIKSGTVIGENSKIGFCSEISNSTIGNGVSIKHSVILDSSIADNTTVGPFAYIRPNCSIGKNVRIGDFVEIKNSNIDDGTKISHLTYVGDSDVGKNINFGCGTVTVNYDGKTKHRTVIEDDAFIGCNTNLIAPVRVGRGAYTAAGSTITEDIPENSLAIARERQTVKTDWVTKSTNK